MNNGRGPGIVLVKELGGGSVGETYSVLQTDAEIEASEMSVVMTVPPSPTVTRFTEGIPQKETSVDYRLLGPVQVIGESNAVCGFHNCHTVLRTPPFQPLLKK
jgi:hypothetical protein